MISPDPCLDCNEIQRCLKTLLVKSAVTQHIKVSNAESFLGKKQDTGHLFNGIDQGITNTEQAVHPRRVMEAPATTMSQAAQQRRLMEAPATTVSQAVLTI